MGASTFIETWNWYFATNQGQGAIIEKVLVPQDPTIEFALVAEEQT